MDSTVQLPGGFQVGDEFVREVEFREMTGVEEEILIDQRKADGGKGKSLKSMSDRLTEILSRCTVRIGSKVCEDNKDPKKASPKAFLSEWNDSYLGDRSVAIVRLRQLSLGDIFAFKEMCPHCKKEIQRVEFDLTNADVQPYFKWIDRDLGIERLKEDVEDSKNSVEAKAKLDAALIRAEEMREALFTQESDYEVTLPKSGSIMRYRLLRRKDEDRLQSIPEKHQDGLITAMLAARLTSIDGEPLTSLKDQRLKYLTLSDRDYLRMFFDDAEGGMDTAVIVKCDDCDHQFQRRLDPSKPGFFHRLGV